MSRNLEGKLSEKQSFDLKSTVSENRLLGLWRMMTGFRSLYFGAMIAIVLGALVRTSYYRVVQYVIDVVVGEGENLQQLPWLGASFVGLAAVEGLFAYLRGTWSAKTAEGIILRLRNYLYDHIQRLPFAFHDYAKTGALIQRSTSDVDALRRFYARSGAGHRAHRGALRRQLHDVDADEHAAGAAVHRHHAVHRGDVVLVLRARLQGLQASYQEQEAKLSTTLQENLSGVRVVKAFAQQPYEIEKFNRENWEKYQRGKKLLIMHSLYWPISDVLCAGQTILVMAVGALMAMRGEITVGTYVAVMGMVIWIIWPMRNLGRLVVQISTGLVSYRRVADVIAQDREDIVSGSVPEDTRIRGEIVFEDVSFSYEPVEVLKDHDEDKKKKRLKDAEPEERRRKRN